MLYNVTATGTARITKIVEASSRQEADEIAEGMRPSVLLATLEVRSYASVSDENYRYHRGAHYLVRRYSSEVVAKCVKSYRKGRSWEHNFSYLDTGKHFTLRYKESAQDRRRVIKLLCEDQKLGDHCDECPAKFYCFTNRNISP